MPELLVMRHAKSDWSTSLDDFDRPLNNRGHGDAPRMGRWLEDNDLAPNRIVTSAANRARTTAQYVADEVGLTADSIDVREELYLASAHDWLDLARSQHGDGRLLICGHNPGLDHLVWQLASEQPARTRTGKLMTTAAIAVFDVDNWQQLAPRSANLVVLMRPRELNLENNDSDNS